MTLEVGHFVNFHPSSPAGVTWTAEVLEVHPNGHADLKVTDGDGNELKKLNVPPRVEGDGKDHVEFFMVPSGGVPAGADDGSVAGDPNAPPPPPPNPAFDFNTAGPQPEGGYPPKPEEPA